MWKIVIDAGGQARTYEDTATRADRRVDVRTGRGLVEVSELAPRGVARSARGGRRVAQPAPARRSSDSFWRQGEAETADRRRLSSSAALPGTGRPRL